MRKDRAFAPSNRTPPAWRSDLTPPACHYDPDAMDSHVPCEDLPPVLSCSFNRVADAGDVQRAIVLQAVQFQAELLAACDRVDTDEENRSIAREGEIRQGVDDGEPVLQPGFPIFERVGVPGVVVREKMS